MLCVGPELAMDMKTTSPMRRAASFRPPPAWSGDCSPAGAALLAGEDIAHLHLGLGCSAQGGHQLASRGRRDHFASYAADPRATTGCNAISLPRYSQSQKAVDPSRSAANGPAAPDHGERLPGGAEHVADVVGGVHERPEEVIF